METLKINTIKSESSESMLAVAPPIMLSQIIHASVEDVFDAWKEVEKMKQWCAPEGMSIRFIESDFRVGGRFILELENLGMKIFSTGTYEEIFPYRHIRYNLSIADKPNNVSVRFRPIGKAKTELLVNHLGRQESEQEDCKVNWSSSLNNLKTHLEKH